MLTKVVGTTTKAAIIVPAVPEKAAATGTTQYPEFADTAHDSNATSPELRSPRLNMAAANGIRRLTLTRRGSSS
jgi:hypothetical protein